MARYYSSLSSINCLLIIVFFFALTFAHLLFEFKFELKQHHTIPKAISVLLLSLFFISIIPKTFFHNLIANHKDEVVCKHPKPNGNCVHQQGFHCGFDDLVVTTPYLLQIAQNSLENPLEFSTHQIIFSTSFPRHYFFHAESRGPPQV